jgi:hypothetical protein
MTNPPGIYLVIEFDWPQPFEPEHGKKARKLHDVVQGKSWIKEFVAGSNGLGSGPSSLWIFWLENYAVLDRLLRNPDDEVSKAFSECFAIMPVVTQKIREEVVFL